MKKIFISMMAVAAVAACAKTEVAYEAPEAIKLSSYADNITKAKGTVTEALGDLNIWLFHEDEISFGSTADAPILYKKGNTYWETEIATAVWPRTGNVSAAGYTPKGSLVLADSYHNTEGVVLSFANPDCDFDLCYADKCTPVASNADPKVLAPNFNHALAKVTVVVKGTAEKFKLQNLSVTTPIVSGTFKSLTSPQWSNTTTATSLSLETTETAIAADGATTTYYFYAIPQKISSIKVGYSYWVAGTTYVPVTAAEYKVNGDAGLDLVAGTHYTITATLTASTEKIQIAAAMTPWETDDDNTVTVE